MKAMYRRNAMTLSAHACAKSAPMTQTATRCAVLLDTALLAVSFLLGVLRDRVALAVRISLSRQAKP